MTVRWAIGALALTVLALLGGCAQKGNEVASVSEPPNELSSDSQAEAADGLADCLRAAGVPATANAVDRVQKIVEIDTDDAFYMTLATGELSSSPGVDATFESEDAVMAKYLEMEPSYAVLEGDERAAVLFIGDSDYTDIYQSCLSLWPYTYPERDDPSDELLQKIAVAEATNDWIDCAREHGYPDLVDVRAGAADSFMTTPTALLPTDISDNDLKALLAACPNYDVDSHRAEFSESDPLSAGWTSEIADPSIGFDAAGWRGIVDESPVDDPELTAHLTALTEVFHAAQDELLKELLSEQ